jgi:excisionase family DNA binding protein
MKTVNEVAKELNITRQRVHQLLKEHRLRVMKPSSKLTLIPGRSYARLMYLRGKG